MRLLRALPTPANVAVFTALAAVALWGVLGVACGSATYVVRQYGGAERPSDAIAMLRVNGGAGIRLVEFDGERLDFRLIRGEHVHIQMLPGEHSVGVVVPNLDPDHGQRVSFVAEAGRIYRVVIRTAAGVGPDWVPVVVEVTSETDVIVREVGPLPSASQRSAAPPAARADAAIEAAPRSEPADSGVFGLGAPAPLDDAGTPPDAAMDAGTADGA